MQFPSRKARVALLAGAATLGIAGTASASTADYSTDTNVLTITADAGAGPDVLECVGGTVKFNGADPTRDGAGAGTTGCAASVNLVVNGDAAANDLDLRGVTRDRVGRPRGRQRRSGDLPRRRRRHAQAAPSSPTRSTRAPATTTSTATTAPTR